MRGFKYVLAASALVIVAVGAAGAVMAATPPAATDSVEEFDPSELPQPVSSGEPLADDAPEYFTDISTLNIVGTEPSPPE